MSFDDSSTAVSVMIISVELQHIRLQCFLIFQNRDQNFSLKIFHDSHKDEKQLWIYENTKKTNILFCIQFFFLYYRLLIKIYKWIDVINYLKISQPTESWFGTRWVDNHSLRDATLEYNKFNKAASVSLYNEFTFDRNNDGILNENGQTLQLVFRTIIL